MFPFSDASTKPCMLLSIIMQSVESAINWFETEAMAGHTHRFSIMVEKANSIMTRALNILVVFLLYTSLVNRNLVSL